MLESNAPQLPQIPSPQTKIRKQLEEEFMDAFQLAPDGLGATQRLADSVCALTRTRGERVGCLDHCSYYTGQGDFVVVTQPYGNHADAAEELESLTLDERTAPEIIPATEWAFYYPGHADLFVLKFPCHYARALAKIKETLAEGWTRSQINSSLPLDRGFKRRLQLLLAA